MAVLSKKSITKSTTSKSSKTSKTKAPTSASSKTAPASKMETTMMVPRF